MCDTPYYKKPNGYLEAIPLPCGKCPVCKQKRVSQWAFRLMEEEKISSSAHFVTLTYNTQYVPITSKGWMTLNKKDVQNFLKRLRKIEPNKLRYYLAGEYGDQKMRPHYHIIIFNLTDISHVEKTWKLGDIHTGRVTGASVAYTAKYIDKDKRIPLHANDDRIPEFSLMSKGLGASYLTPAIINYHKADLLRCFVKTQDGYSVSLPRYFRNRIYTDQEKLDQIRQIKIVKKQERDIIEKTLPPYRTIEEHEQSQRMQRLTQFNNRKNKLRQ
jgi:hypothetical protein